MDYKEQINALKNLEAIAYGYNINGEVLRMDCSDFEQIMVDAADSITDLLARAEAAEAAQETLQRTVAEYKARSEKAERERDAAVNDLKKEVMGKILACDYCKKNDPDDFQCTHDDLCGCHEWEWRGQKE